MNKILRILLKHSDSINVIVDYFAGTVTRYEAIKALYKVLVELLRSDEIEIIRSSQPMISYGPGSDESRLVMDGIPPELIQGIPISMILLFMELVKVLFARKS